MKVTVVLVLIVALGTIVKGLRGKRGSGKVSANRSYPDYSVIKNKGEDWSRI